VSAEKWVVLVEYSASYFDDGDELSSVQRVDFLFKLATTLEIQNMWIRLYID